MIYIDVQYQTKLLLFGFSMKVCKHGYQSVQGVKYLCPVQNKKASDIPFPQMKVISHR